jgi:hypothetical protein
LGVLVVASDRISFESSSGNSMSCFVYEVTLPSRESAEIFSPRESNASTRSQSWSAKIPHSSSFILR